MRNLKNTFSLFWIFYEGNKLFSIIFENTIFSSFLDHHLDIILISFWHHLDIILPSRILLFPCFFVSFLATFTDGFCWLFGRSRGRFWNFFLIFFGLSGGRFRTTWGPFWPIFGSDRSVGLDRSAGLPVSTEWDHRFTGITRMGSPVYRYPGIIRVGSRCTLESPVVFFNSVYPVTNMATTNCPKWRNKLASQKSGNLKLASGT